MPVGAAIGAAGSIGSSIIGGVFSSKASDKQIAAGQQALALQRQAMEMSQANFNTTRDQINSNSQPFINTGQGATMSLAQLYGLTTPGNPGGAGANGAYGPEALAAFERSPDYAFARDEGLKALTFQDSASGGGLLSRGHLNNTVQFGQGLATSNFGNYTGRLMSLAQLGAGSAANANTSLTGLVTGQNNNNAQLTALGTGTYNNIGQAGAAGTLGIGNALQNGLGGITNNLAQYNAVNRGSSYATSVPNSPGAGLYTGNPAMAGFGPTNYGALPAPTGIQWPTTGAGGYW